MMTEEITINEIAEALRLEGNALELETPTYGLAAAHDDDAAYPRWADDGGNNLD